MLLAGHRKSFHVIQSPGPFNRQLEGLPPSLRVNFGAGMVGTPLADNFSGFGINNHNLAGLGGRVRSRDIPALPDGTHDG